MKTKTTIAARGGKFYQYFWTSYYTFSWKRSVNSIYIWLFHLSKHVIKFSQLELN